MGVPSYIVPFFGIIQCKKQKIACMVQFSLYALIVEKTGLQEPCNVSYNSDITLAII